MRFKITKRCKEAKICARNEVQDKSLKHKSAKGKTKKHLISNNVKSYSRQHLSGLHVIVQHTHEPENVHQKERPSNNNV